jgi:hypothetical protein
MASVLARRAWLNLGLLALVSGLAVMTLTEPGRESPPRVPTLLELAPENIGRITVERLGQASLRFELRAAQWWMTAPDQGPANLILIKPILQLAAARCPLRYAAAETDLPTLGFEPPRVRLRLNDIQFGVTAPTDGQRYLRVGATIHLCPDRLYPLLTSAAASFLAPALDLPAAATNEP